jgi:HEAT repeat protein
MAAPEAAVRQWGVCQLRDGTTGPVPDAVQVDLSLTLIRLLEDPIQETRHCAASALEHLGQPAVASAPVIAEAIRTEAVPILASWLSQDTRDAVQAAEALAGLGELGAGAEPALRRALGDSEPLVRGRAAVALGRIGKRGRRSVGALIDLMEGDQGWVAAAAAEALFRLRTRRARRALLDARAEGLRAVRQLPVWALEKESDL